MGCTLLQRLHHQCGGSTSIPNTCKYKAQIGTDGTIYIIPSINGCPSIIKISVGDATIEFDTKSPPSFLKAVITSPVTSGNYAPPIKWNRPRANATYTSAQLKQVPFTDANKKVTQVPLMEVTGYKSFNIQKSSVFKAMGATSTAQHPTQRIVW